jgi:hypothetical protein
MDREYNYAYPSSQMQPAKSESVVKEDGIELLFHGRASSETRWSSIRTEATSITSWWSSARTDTTRWSSVTAGGGDVYVLPPIPLMGRIEEE